MLAFVTMAISCMRVSPNLFVDVIIMFTPFSFEGLKFIMDEATSKVVSRNS